MNAISARRRAQRAARRRRQLALDDAGDDRVLALGLDLIGDDELALARLQQIDRVALHRLGIEEPAGQLGQLEQRRPTARASAGSAVSAGSGAGGVAARRAGSQRANAAGGEVPRARCSVERLADDGRARGPARPRPTAASGRRAARPARPPAASCVISPPAASIDARLVVDDERAERHAPEAPSNRIHTAREPLPSTPAEPRARGALGPPLDHRPRRRPRRRLHAALGEAIERQRARPGAARGPGAVRGQRLEHRQGGGAVRVGERAQRVVEGGGAGAVRPRGQRRRSSSRVQGRGRAASRARSSRRRRPRYVLGYCQPRRKKGWAGASWKCTRRA